MYCATCGAHNDDTNRFCLSCGTALAPATVTAVQSAAPVASALPAVPRPTVQPVIAPIIVAPPKPSGPVALAAPVGGIGGIVGGAAAAIGWFMPWFGLGQLGASLGGLAGLLLGSGGGGGLASLLGGGIGGSGFQLLLLAVQGLSLVNSFSNLGGPYGARTDTSTAFLIALLAILSLALIPIMGLLCIRAGMAAFQERSATDSISVGLVKNQLNALTNNSAIGFVLMVVIFILLSQIPFATMLLSSGFFIAAGGFALTWFAALMAKGQVKPIYQRDMDSSKAV